MSGGKKAAGWLLDGLHLPVDGGEGDGGGRFEKGPDRVPDPLHLGRRVVPLLTAATPPHQLAGGVVVETRRRQRIFWIPNFWVP